MFCNACFGYGFLYFPTLFFLSLTWTFCLFAIFLSFNKTHPAFPSCLIPLFWNVFPPGGLIHWHCIQVILCWFLWRWLYKSSSAFKATTLAGPESRSFWEIVLHSSTTPWKNIHLPQWEVFWQWRVTRVRQGYICCGTCFALLSPRWCNMQ